MRDSLIFDIDHLVRSTLTRSIADLGYAPHEAALSAMLGISLVDLRDSLQRLHDAHALLLHPHSGKPWVVHPFALSAGSCWVETPKRGYWANCLYCAFGIAAALRSDATITTRLGGEAETIRYTIRDGRCVETLDIFHLSTPAAAWWDNVIFACASFQPFPSKADVVAWCRRHDMPEGAILTVPALWDFAQDWYGGYLDDGWRKRSVKEARAVFAKHGLTSDFWMLP